VKHGRTHGRTDSGTDGRPENILPPPAPTGGGGLKNGKYLESFPAGCRVGSTMLSADMLVRGGAGSSAVLADRDVLVIGA